MFLYFKADEKWLTQKAVYFRIGCKIR